MNGVISRLPVEQVPPGEDAAIESMIRTLQAQIKERYRNTTALRDAHPKHHGLVTATFIVDPHCPIVLRHGLFSAPEQYRATIRFSNGQPVVNHDLTSDIRGMAIHLETPHLSCLGGDDRAQDFLLATGEGFFGTNAPDYVDFPAASESLIKTVKYFVGGGRFRGGLQLLKARKRPPSPLVAEYFSQTPYRLGPHCVKYQVRPSESVPMKRPWYVSASKRIIFGWCAVLAGLKEKGREQRVRRVPYFNAMRDALARDLAAGPVKLEFLVQRWPDLSELPVWAIEDPTRTWNAPWVRVATIQVHQQTDAEIRRRDAEAERTNFTVWRALPAHQPLGGINRARLAIYREMSAFRTRLNAQRRPQP